MNVASWIEVSTAYSHRRLGTLNKAESHATNNGPCWQCNEAFQVTTLLSCGRRGHGQEKNSNPGYDAKFMLHATQTVHAGSHV
eukprot:scaffold116_cov334-Pavlova_lutheri.AAC.71